MSNKMCIGMYKLSHVKLPESHEEYDDVDDERNWLVIWEAPDGQKYKFRPWKQNLENGFIYKMPVVVM